MRRCLFVVLLLLAPLAAHAGITTLVAVDVVPTTMPASAYIYRKAVLIENRGSVPIWCGYDRLTLSVGNGHQVGPGEAREFPSDTIFCLTATKQTGVTGDVTVVSEGG